MTIRRVALATLVLGALPTAAAIADPGRTTYANSPLMAPIGPAAAPDGGIWFGEDGASRLGHVAADGTLTEVAVPKAQHPQPHRELGLDDGLRVEAVGADGRAWFIRDDESRVGVVDPATHAVTMLDVGVSSGALTITADGSVWVAGDLSGAGGASGVVRIAPDQTRTTIATGGERASYALAPAATPGAVVDLLSGVGVLAARQIDAAGASVPITLPANTSGNGTTSVATGAAGTFIATDGDLLRVDADHVARKVPDLSPGDGRRPLALGHDGSIWLTDDLGTERVVPGAPPRLFASPLKLFKEPAGFKPAGLAVATSNNAWLAVSQSGAPKRERLLRFSPSGQVSELVLGTPPSASATVPSGTDGDLQAGALARGVRTSLKVRVRCSAACSVRVAARDGYASTGRLIYARKTATLARAGVRTVTLRATRHASRKASRNAFRLEAVLTDRSGYVRKTVAARGAGALIPRP